MIRYGTIIYILFFGFMFISARGQEQAGVPPDLALPEQSAPGFMHTGDGYFVIDSTYYYVANAYGQDWFNDQRYRVTERDRWGNLISAVTLEYDTLEGNWFENDRYNETYYDSTNIALWLASVWDKKGQKWRLSDSVAYFYNNLPAIRWYKVWNPVKFRFSRGRRVIYHYDGENVSQNDIQKFDTLSGNWKNFQKIFYSYLPDIALPDTEMVMEWDTLNFVWENASQTIYSYNNENKPESEITMLWGDGGQWENSSRISYLYDDFGRLEQKVFFSWFYGDWDKTKRDVYSYDGNNRLSKTLSQYWDDFGNEWVNTMMTLSFYNDDGLRTELIYKYWGTFEYWINLSDYLYTYDDHGNRIEFLYRNWDEDIEQWVDYYKNINYWSEFIPNEIIELSQLQVNIFPNPATDFINLTVDENAGSGVFSLYSMEGRLVFKTVFNGNRAQFRLDGLPKGPYYYIVGTGKGIFSQILIIR